MARPGSSLSARVTITTPRWAGPRPTARCGRHSTRARSSPARRSSGRARWADPSSCSATGRTPRRATLSRGASVRSCVLRSPRGVNLTAMSGARSDGRRNCDDDRIAETSPAQASDRPGAGRGGDPHGRWDPPGTGGPPARRSAGSVQRPAECCRLAVVSRHDNRAHSDRLAVTACGRTNGAGYTARASPVRLGR